MNPEQKNILKNKLLKIRDLSDSRHEKYFSWLKNILTVSVGLLGILVSLNSEKITELPTFLLFSSTILFLGLAILFGVILLYNEVYTQSQLRRNEQKTTRNILDGKESKIVEIIKRHWFFSFSEVVCFSSYLISLISLILYSISKVYDKGIFN